MAYDGENRRDGADRRQTICKDCLGPVVLDHDLKNLNVKIDQICGWKRDIELYTQKREEDEIKYRILVSDKFSSAKNWAIANLVALCFLLAGTVLVLLRQ